MDASDFAGDILHQAESLLRTGQAAAASKLLWQVLETQPDHIEARFLLGQCFMAEHNGERALEAFRLVTEAMPQNADAWLKRAEALIESADSVASAYRDAALLMHKAVRLNPHNIEMTRVLADYARRSGLGAMLIEACLHRVELEADSAAARYELAVALWDEGRSGEAWQTLNAALSLDPRHQGAMIHQAFGLFGAGEVGLALEQFQQIRAANPELRDIQSNCAIALNYVEDEDPQRILTAYRSAARSMFASGPVRLSGTESKPLEQDGRLRIGFISPDLRQHSIAYFLEPLLERLNRKRYHLIAYSNATLADDVTTRLRTLCDDWVETAELTDIELATRIRDDGAHIAIDLAGFTAGNRLGALSFRPAPLQMTWLGSPTTTGLSAIDMRITDWKVDPDGYEAFQSETPLRLPDCYLCYRAPQSAPEVASLPALERGFITFGSFNNLAKLSPGTVEMWVAVLRAIPTARLLLKSRLLEDEGVSMHIRQRLVRQGVANERIAVSGWREDARSHLAMYADVDIALDTFPYNGVTTLCEALWMGVPVVSRCGPTHAARQGLSLLTAAGLLQFVADSQSDFVQRCVSLAGDVAALARLRAELRGRVRGSILCDEAAFIRRFERQLEWAWSGHTNASDRRSGSWGGAGDALAPPPDA